MAGHLPENAKSDAPLAHDGSVAPIFISHSSADVGVAMQICAALEAADIMCWIAPRDIPAGADYTESIMSALNECRALLLVYSRHSAESDPVLGEVERVINRKKLLIPVRIENTPASKGMEFLISRRQWIDAYPSPVDRHLPALVAGVQRSLGMQVVKPDVPIPEVPEFIGPYRILGILGEGGMGIVYRGEQRTPIKRPVAVKVIRAGFDTKEVIARFESERQALARMDHPHVAKVLEAGADQQGHPFFVMEYVPGRPITQFADEYKLTIRQRLELFVQVCEAIAHAHSKGLIHRDIKASNVLAYMADGQPSVKVIDFGVAKALTGDRLTDRTQFTESGQVVGTYDSMSPEQAAGSADIDTRSDVYSLGSLLYELLTGAKPFDDTTLSKAADEEKRRIIREVEPPKPSTRVSGLGKEGAVVAAARQVKIESLARDLKSELEWIPLKALRKERNRRYPSALALADDVRNYLGGRALMAAPESRVYRLRKWASRNRAALATIGAFLLLLAASIGTYIGGMRAEQATTLQALGQAETARNEAEGQRKSAIVAQQETQATLADMHASFGLVASERRRPAEAALWFANATLLSQDDFHRSRANRVRFRSWCRETALPIRAFTTDSSVLKLRFDPSGRYLLAVTGQESEPEKRVHSIWDVEREKRVPVSVSEGSCNLAVWNVAGDLLAIGSSTGQFNLYGFPSLGRLRQCSCTKAPTAVAFSRDGRFMAFAADKVRLWDCGGGTGDLAEIDLTGVTNLEFNARGDRLVAATNGRIHVYQVSKNGRDAKLCYSPILLKSDYPDLIRFLLVRDTKLVTLTVEGTITWRDTETGTELSPPQRLGNDLILCAEANADRSRLAVTYCHGCEARLFSLLTRRFEGGTMQHGNTVRSPVFSPKGDELLTVSGDRTACFWSVPEGRRRGAPLPHQGEPRCAAFSPDGYFFATGQADGLVRVWTLPTPLNDLAIPIQATDERLVGSPDGRYIMPAGWTDYRNLISTRVYALSTGTPAGPPLLVGALINGGALSPDGRHAVTVSAVSETVGQSSPGEVTVRWASQPGWIIGWDWQTGKTVFGPLLQKSEPIGAAYSGDGSQLAVICAAGLVLLIDPDSGRVLRQWKQDTGKLPNCLFPQGWIQFSPNGKRIATIGTDFKVRLWRTDSDLPIRTLSYKSHNEGAFMEVCFSRDSHWLATACENGNVCVWNADTGEPASPTLEHADWVFTIAFSPDAHYLLTACRDCTAQVWDWRTGTKRGSPMQHDNEVFNARFVSDGNWVITTSRDRTIRVWDWLLGAPVQPLRRFQGAYPGSIAVSRDGRRAAVAGYMMNAKEIPVLDLSDLYDGPDRELSPTDLCQLAEIISGMHIQGARSDNLTSEQWLDRWQDFRRRFPQFHRFAPSSVPMVGS